MGDGDVRLSPLLGAYLGWLNPGFVAVGLFLGFFAGAVVGVAMMATRPRRTKDCRAVRAVPGRSARSSPCSSVSVASTSSCAADDQLRSVRCRSWLPSSTPYMA